MRKEIKMGDRISKPRVIAFLISALVPLVIVALGVFLYIAGTILNIPYILTFILLPLISLILSALLIFSDWHVVIKLLLEILLIAAVVCGFLFLNTIGGFEMLNHYDGDDLEEKYTEATEHREYMPELSEVGTPLDMDYYSYFTQYVVFFTCETDTLICKYTEEEYAEQKALLDEKYEFEEESQHAELFDEEYIAEPFAEIDGYYFRILKHGAGSDNYPKRVMLIATNDSTNEIVYMYFVDDDLDFLMSTSDFINYDCGWRRIAGKHLDEPFEINDLRSMLSKA